MTSSGFFNGSIQLNVTNLGLTMSACASFGGPGNDDMDKSSSCLTKYGVFRVIAGVGSEKYEIFSMVSGHLYFLSFGSFVNFLSK